MNIWFASCIPPAQEINLKGVQPVQNYWTSLKSAVRALLAACFVGAADGGPVMVNQLLPLVLNMQ